MTSDIYVKELAIKFAQNEKIFLLDVRSFEEHQLFNLGGTLLPLSELPFRMSELPKDIPIIVYCRSGHRSETARQLLSQAGFLEVKNLVGGILAWQQEMENPPL